MGLWVEKDSEFNTEFKKGGLWVEKDSEFNVELKK
jgi:hypothetical protein